MFYSFVSTFLAIRHYLFVCNFIKSCFMAFQMPEITCKIYLKLTTISTLRIIMLVIIEIVFPLLKIIQRIFIYRFSLLPSFYFEYKNISFWIKWFMRRAELSCGIKLRLKVCVAFLRKSNAFWRYARRHAQYDR